MLYNLLRTIDWDSSHAMGCHDSTLGFGRCHAPVFHATSWQRQHESMGSTTKFKFWREPSYPKRCADCYTERDIRTLIMAPKSGILKRSPSHLSISTLNSQHNEDFLFTLASLHLSHPQASSQSPSYLLTLTQSFILPLPSTKLSHHAFQHHHRCLHPRPCCLLSRISTR